MGPIRLAERAPSLLWDGASGCAVFHSGSLGFADASEDDRANWLGTFRRLLDGLDSPLQVVIDVRPGAESVGAGLAPLPADLGEMRGADMCFVEDISRSTAAHRFSSALVASDAQGPRLESAFRELGLTNWVDNLRPEPVFGRELIDCFLHAGGFSHTWSVERLPGTQLEPGWLFRLLPQGLRLRLSWHATPLPAAWIVAYLQRQLINMRATRLIEQDVGSTSFELAAALPNAEDLQRRVASSQEKAFHVSAYITLTAASRAELAAGAVKVEAAARAILCNLQPCTFRMRDGFLATLPGGPDRLMRKRVLDSSALATFLPWREAEVQHSGGLAIGRQSVTGTPVLIDPFDQRRFANANIGVFGHSGAGKTFLLSTLAMGALGLGTQVYIVDPEHEYGGLARQLGGIDVQLALGSGHALNVLDLRPSDRHDETWLGPAAADAVDLCACICGELDESERAVVESAVRLAYNDVSQPVLRDVAARLPAGSRVAVILGRWVSGSLGQMFSAQTNVDLEAPIVAFGMRELRDEMVAPVHFLLAEALWSRIKRRDRRRMLIVDELGLLFEDATIRRFVVSLARRIRKYDGSLVFATQNPGDLLSSDQGAVVATNPAVLFLGAQRPGEAAKLQSAFHLSDRQKALLETARRGDFLLVAGRDRLSLEVKAPPWQEEAMRLGRAAARSPPGPLGLVEMPRVLHYRLYGLPSHRLEAVHEEFGAMVRARTWRCGLPWIASSESRGLFDMEFFRHLRAEEPIDLSAAGFVKMAGDETDALILTIFMRDLSSEFDVRAVITDLDHPLAKLRRLEFDSGRLPGGTSLEDVLAKRPVIKKVRGERIFFYPPTFRLHSQGPPNTTWAYALCGMRAFAPTLLEAEQEALKILRGLRHLDH
ncbi:MAG: VirB4 family type IV secretion system protein [Candidatus Dormibacterales bacterium]